MELQIHTRISNRPIPPPPTPKAPYPRHQHPGTNAPSILPASPLIELPVELELPTTLHRQWGRHLSSPPPPFQILTTQQASSLNAEGDPNVTATLPSLFCVHPNTSPVKKLNHLSYPSLTHPLPPPTEQSETNETATNPTPFITRGEKEIERQRERRGDTKHQTREPSQRGRSHQKHRQSVPPPTHPNQIIQVSHAFPSCTKNNPTTQPTDQPAHPTHSTAQGTQNSQKTAKKTHKTFIFSPTNRPPACATQPSTRIAKVRSQSQFQTRTEASIPTKQRKAPVERLSRQHTCIACDHRTAPHRNAVVAPAPLHGRPS